MIILLLLHYSCNHDYYDYINISRSISVFIIIISFIIIIIIIFSNQ